MCLYMIILILTNLLTQRQDQVKIKNIYIYFAKVVIQQKQQTLNI